MSTNATVSVNNDLPIVLVSASDLQNAYDLISELVNREILDGKERITESIVWQIVNKYYHVNVEMYPLADDTSPPETITDRIEAHVIYIGENEEDDEAVAEERWARAGASRAHVCLLVARGAALRPALLAWCRRRRYEPVPLRERAQLADLDPDQPFPETYGAERARAALHAHTWRGLRRVDGAGAGAGEGEDGEDEGAVERAELFAEALGALGAAGRGGEELPRDERLRRAERLVAAFCRALGDDLPAL